MELLGYFLAIGMGLSLGIIGGGGAILTVPLLVYFFHQEGRVATTQSLFVVGVTALAGALINARQKRIDFKMGFQFALPSFVGVLVSRKLILPLIPDQFSVGPQLEITKSLLLLMIFSVLMIFASLAMIRSGQKNVEAPGSDQNRLMSITMKGFGVGLTTGLVGAGGGFLIIPALVLLLKLPMRIAVGTSLAIIAANALFGFALTLREQAPDWNLILSVAGMGLLGLLIGVRLSTRVDESKLKKFFGYFVFAVGISILLDQILHFIF